MITDRAATRSLNGVRGKEWRRRFSTSVLDAVSLSAKAAAMARAVSASGRPLSVAKHHGDLAEWIGRLDSNRNAAGGHGRLRIGTDRFSTRHVA